MAKQIKAEATGIVWTFPDDLADSLLRRKGEFSPVEDAPKRAAKKAPPAKSGDVED